MKTLTISVASKSAQVQPSGLCFPPSPQMFEWIALLAYSTKMQINEGWVTLEQVQGLPHWSTMSRHHAGTNVTRYLLWLKRRNLSLVETETATRGRYRMRIERSDIDIDVAVEKLASCLGVVHHGGDEPALGELLSFMTRHFSAVALLNRWRLAAEPGTQNPWPKSATGIWMELAGNEASHPALRLLAYIYLMAVLDERGQYASGRGLIEEAQQLAAGGVPKFLLARLYFSCALLVYRRGGAEAEHEEHRLLKQARDAALGIEDRFLLGVYASRKGLGHEKVGNWQEALQQFSSALWSYTLIESYEKVQDSCYNIGRVLQSKDSKQARRWLKLAVFLAERMKVGTSRIMTEIILSKIALEGSDHDRYMYWLEEAEEHSRLSRSPIDKAWCHFLRAMDCARRGTPAEADLIRELSEARRLYVRPDYNWLKLDKYFARKFGPVWEKVLRKSPSI